MQEKSRQITARNQEQYGFSAPLSEEKTTLPTWQAVPPAEAAVPTSVVPTPPVLPSSASASFWNAQWQRLLWQKECRRVCTLVGATLLLFFAASNLLGILIEIPLVGISMALFDSANPMENDLLAQIFQMAVYIPSVTLPFLLIAKMLPAQKTQPAGLSGQKSGTKWLLIGVGLGGCVLASYIAGLLTSWISSLTHLPFEVPLETPTTPVAIVLFFISTAVLPALLEEWVFRGVVLRRLRPYGATFAILVSAGAFAFAHGTFTQLFGTFVMGVVFAFLALQTGKLWPGMVVHFLNNFYACLGTLLLKKYPEEQLGGIFIWVDLCLLLIGIGCMVFLALRRGDLFTLQKGCCPLTAGEKSRCLFQNPAVIFAIVVSLGLSALVVALTPMLNQVSESGAVSSQIAGWVMLWPVSI